MNLSSTNSVSGLSHFAQFFSMFLCHSTFYLTFNLVLTKMLVLFDKPYKVLLLILILNFVDLNSELQNMVLISKNKMRTFFCTR